MSKSIAIIAGEPNSISSEIIFKSWNVRKKYFHKPYFVIGSIRLLKLHIKKLKFNIKIKKINTNFKISDLNKNELAVYNIEYNQRKSFEKIKTKSNKYILKCFDKAIEFSKNKKILGFINCPVSKETLFKNKHQGITEFISKKFQKKGNEVMLIYNKQLSVAPVTTHIPLSQVSKKINKKMIVRKIITINNFYKNILNKRPNFAILGLNPHNYYDPKKLKEKEIIKNVLITLKKLKIKVSGPIPADSSFVNFKENKFDVIIGMYHDQVLGPFKAIFKYDAINITLGIPCIRISPDHGVAENIVGKRIANPKSLISSIKFFNNIK
jgi:4-hydroxythreonine-4-phosphate dehydrogenase